MTFDLKQLGRNVIYVERQSKEYVEEILDKLAKKSPDTLMHSIDFANRLVQLKNIFKLNNRQLSHLYTAALIHDVGKTSSKIRQELLSKRGMTRAEVFNSIALPHINETEKMLKKYYEAGKISRTAYLLAVHHHEKLNGSGYPYGLKKSPNADTYKAEEGMAVSDELTIFDSLFSAIDVLSAISMKRAYRDRVLSPAERIEVLYDKVSSGEQDREVVDKVVDRFIYKEVHIEK